jgi:transposase-like protein
MCDAMPRDSRDPRLPPYSQRTQAACPKCERADIEVLPPNNPGSKQEWFRCRACDHMWSQRRDRTDQGHN